MSDHCSGDEVAAARVGVPDQFEVDPRASALSTNPVSPSPDRCRSGWARSRHRPRRVPRQGGGFCVPQAPRRVTPRTLVRTDSTWLESTKRVQDCLSDSPNDTTRALGSARVWVVADAGWSVLGSIQSSSSRRWASGRLSQSRAWSSASSRVVVFIFNSGVKDPVSMQRR